MKLHIFPAGPLCSLRRALMVWMLPLFLVVGAASAAVSYWTYSRMVWAFMDDQMLQLAQSLSAHDAPMPMLPQSAERVHRMGGYVTQYFDADGRLVASSWPELRTAQHTTPGFGDIEQGGHAWRVYTVPAAAPGGHAVQVLQSGTFRRSLAFERAGAVMLPILILIPLSMLVLWALARAMSRELQEIGRQAAQQDEHTISELPLTRVPGEIVPLVQSFNSLLRRLRDAFSAQRRFVQDAAHELRTPITAIALQMENLRPDCQTCDAQERFSQLEAGVRRAQRLVDQLLRLSRQETSGADGVATVDLQAQLRESVNTLIALADRRHIDLGLVEADKPVTMRLQCAPGDLRSLLDNLIENALRYTPEGGVVDVRLVEDNGRPVLEVVDTGPGIPPEMLPRVFDRFFRVPGTGPGGSGLGLAIARAAAQRCGLRLTLRNREDRSGLVARVEPVA